MLVFVEQNLDIIVRLSNLLIWLYLHMNYYFKVFFLLLLLSSIYILLLLFINQLSEILWRKCIDPASVGLHLFYFFVNRCFR